jgi:hypothetical protein
MKNIPVSPLTRLTFVFQLVNCYQAVGVDGLATPKEPLNNSLR